MDKYALPRLIRLYRYARAEAVRAQATHGAASPHTFYSEGRADGMRQALQILTEEMKTVPNPLPV